MKTRKIIIAILCVILLGVILYLTAGIKMPSQETMGENVTVVEAPEQETAMENENFKVEEFVPVIPEGENIAKNGKVECNGFNETYTAKKAIDGRTAGASYWEGESDAFPNELSLTYKEAPVTVHAIRLCLNPDSLWGKRTQTFSVACTAADGTTKELVPSTSYDFDPLTGNEVVLEFDPVELTSLILSFTENTGAKGAQVAELEVYSE